MADEKAIVEAIVRARAAEIEAAALRADAEAAAQEAERWRPMATDLHGTVRMMVNELQALTAEVERLTRVIEEQWKPEERDWRERERHLLVEVERLRAALLSIARNTCCADCTEAAKVAAAALDAAKKDR